MPVVEAAPEQAAAVLPAVLGGPSGRAPQPVLPEAPVAEAFRLPESAQGVAVAVLPAALLGAPTEALAALVPYQAPALAVVRTAPGQIDQRGPEGLPASGQAAPPIPVAVQAAAVLGEAGAAFAPPLVPGASAAVRPAAFPAPPGTGPESDEPPTVSLAPPAPPAPPAAVAEPGIPGAASLFVRLAVPQTVPDAEAEEVVGLLREIGVGDSRVTRVGFKVNETHVRFYSPEDAAAAAALAEMIGTEARDHTSFRPRPPGGTLEIFLAGERTAPPPRAAASNRVRQQPPDELSRMRDRIVNRLRRGEHL
jgi:hypothetical protein